MRWLRRVLPLLCALATPYMGPAAGETFRDCDECPLMARLPAGRFDMGVAPGEEAREQLASVFQHRSEPRRSVTVAEFAIGRHEVTRGEYRAFVRATGHAGAGCFAWTGNDFALDSQRAWDNTGYAQTDAHPVACVSWNDAAAYTRWLTQRTGKA